MSFRISNAHATPTFVNPPTRTDESSVNFTGGVSIPGKNYGQGRAVRVQSGTSLRPHKYNIRHSDYNTPLPAALIGGGKIDLESRYIKLHRPVKHIKRSADKEAMQIFDTGIEGVQKVKVPADIRGSMGTEGGPISLAKETRRTRTEKDDMITLYHRAAGAPKMKVRVKNSGRRTRPPKE
jgi:hypothetical protein